MEIYKKLAAAKESIKNTKIEKQGKNTFSKYSYFTPSQIETLVSDACKDNGLITMFNLKRNELGETGFLTIVDIDSGDSIVFEMATAIPSIKATNIAQQLGGCVTYTERYLKTSAFGIIDNSLDFDTTENTKKAEKKPVDKTQSKATRKEIEEAIEKCTTVEQLSDLKAKEPIWMNEIQMVKIATDKYNKITKGF